VIKDTRERLQEKTYQKLLVHKIDRENTASRGLKKSEMIE
jgi:hypothetical protein